MRIEFADSSLEKFYLQGSLRWISPALAPRVRKCLVGLEKSTTRTFIRLPGTHKLHRKGFWAISVSGAWRICFRVKASGFSDVYLTQYH